MGISLSKTQKEALQKKKRHSLHQEWTALYHTRKRKSTLYKETQEVKKKWQL